MIKLICLFNYFSFIQFNIDGLLIYTVCKVFSYEMGKLVHLLDFRRKRMKLKKFSGEKKY